MVFRSYPVDHLGGVTAGTADGSDLLAARFAGQPLPPPAPDSGRTRTSGKWCRPTGLVSGDGA